MQKSLKVYKKNDMQKNKKKLTNINTMTEIFIQKRDWINELQGA